MKKLVIEEVPDIIFWKKYSDLWYSSKDKSPFQAPLLLQYFSSNNKNVFAVQLIIDEKLAGAFFLSKNNNNYSFLSDLKTDFNFFIGRRGVVICCRCCVWLGRRLHTRRDKNCRQNQKT